MSDFEFLKKAYEFAIEHSTDPSTQNGAVLVKESEIVASGANHFPRGVQELPERWQRPAKYQFVEHAERNAIFDAARNGVPTSGLTMYCPWFACADCARAIIQAGIVEVVGHYDPHAEYRFGQPVSDVWKNSIKVALGMLEEAGVKMRWIDDKILSDEQTILFNGVSVSP
jgi:dCMP deaminase